MDDNIRSAGEDHSALSRRTFIKGTVGVGLVAGLGSIVEEVALPQAAHAASTPVPALPTPGLNETVPLPTTTAPEQLHLAFGAEPAREVTVSWSAPGTVSQPAAALAYSKSPITASNPGKLIHLPPPEPLDLARPRPQASTTSFTDGLGGQTTYHYHVQLKGLEPDTTYYYQVTDGAASPAVAGSSFKTAPVGRVKYRFSSFGDMGEPSGVSPINASGIQWASGNDRCVLTVDAIENPGDGRGAPLFHLLNGDFCYANGVPANTPSVWRDFGVNIARSAANRPWMPAIGNHECEWGVCDHAGRPYPGPIADAGAAGSYWNGPYGDGNFYARWLLPDNGVVNHDGNHLRGAFYKFQVGTVLFVTLDANDVIYQQDDNAATGSGLTYQSGAAIPAGLLANNREMYGTLVPHAENNSMVPGGHTPNVQIRWLERTLAKGRHDPTVDMIVVVMHQVAMTSAAGSESDLGIRQAWLPIFDRYEVDLVINGHAHLYERTYPVRGYDPPSGTVTHAFGNYAVGDTIDTRRPTVVTTQPAMLNGTPAWNTSHGTVFLTLGGGGVASALPYGVDPANNMPQAGVEVTLNGKYAVEDAPWSAGRDPSDAVGYAIFDVDPGHGPGHTTITMNYYQVPFVTNGQTPPPAATTPLETHVFGRKVPVVRS